MTRTERLLAAVCLVVLAKAAVGRGVTPYLPLNLEPEMESEIERVLILAGKPVMRRPIAAATVLDALPAACERDRVLCERVGRYLARFTHVSDLTHASVEGASTHGADLTLPDSYGLHNRSVWDASLTAYVQPSDYLLVNIGAVAYDGRENFTNSYLSVGFSKAQLDIGYKPHWLSPFTDRSMLMSTEAPTMPSVSLSNYEPLTRMNISYEIFDARMSKSDRIVWQASPTGYTSGRPFLGGVQLTAEPVSGWSFGVNRLVQFGGGARGGASITRLLQAMFNPSRYSNTNAQLSVDQKATNQEASFISSLVIPGPVPFSVYAEYAGEDTSRGRNYLLGDSALSWGIHFPRIARRFDLTLEATEWQNAWYEHSVWQDGMTNYGLVVSNWFGDERVRGDGVGGRSAMAKLGWDPQFGGRFELRYRTLQNQVYGVIPYHHFNQTSLSYSHPWKGLVLGGEFDTGSDVFGKSFSRLAGFVRYDTPGSLAALGFGGPEDETGSTGAESKDSELFVDLGVSRLRARIDLASLIGPQGQLNKYSGPSQTHPSVGIGARRITGGHSDVGARIDLDELDHRSLIGVRLIDYRYRFDSSPLAIGAFFGAARYALVTPAYGIYYGAGLQWRDMLPHLDLGLEGRFYDSVARRHVLPTDPATQRPDDFFDISGAVLSASYHF
ncbi:MAG: hypothetical protein JSR67_10305 [Proteobacteria bacterium]|nr:hypothetical protein [Pseudomonadota bacterium]